MKVNLSMSTRLVDLSKLVPGKLPLEIFNAIAYLTVTPVVELIVTDGKTVLLRRRPDTDQYWPGQYCIPGSIVYSGGPKSFEEYLEKNLTGLSININATAESELAGVELYTTRRGDEVAIIYKVYADMPTDLRDGLSIVAIKDVTTLDLIAEHKDILKKYLIG